MDPKKDNEGSALAMDDFYCQIQKLSTSWNKTQTLRYITSRSTDENLHVIQMLCLDIKNTCKSFCAPVEGISPTKNESRIEAFKYFICNTSFASLLALGDNRAIGYVQPDIQPPFSPYLFVEILWDIGFEDILAESILYLPLDLCVDILEILPRCMNLLDFQRASKFLARFIFNAYKKYVTLRDLGSQSENIVENCKKFTGSLQELILLFGSESFSKLESNVKVNYQYRRYGILLKVILKMVKMCITGKFKNDESECDMEKMYKLVFWEKPIKKLDATVFQELLDEIDRELITLLLNKVKEIDCNIYLNWTEYNDEENTSMTLQRAIGLECHFLMEDIKNLDCSDIQKFHHLIECLGQLASKPDPKDNIENLQPEELLHGASEGNVNCLVSLFERHKEWDISLLTKDICLDLVEQFAEKLGCAHEQSELEKLQASFLTFMKAIVHLNIMELYEVTIKCIFQFSENDRMETIIDIASFEKFIIHNPYLTNSTNLRVILYFLCLSTKSTLRILLKMVIEHSDYQFVAVSLDDLMLLLPILKIRTLSKYDTIMETLCETFYNKEKGSKVHCEKWRLTRKKEKELDGEPKTLALVIQVLQEICLAKPLWNINKFANLLSMLKSFCSVSEIVEEILAPLLLSCTDSVTYLKCALTQLHKLIGTHDFNTTPDLAIIFERVAVYLLHSDHISKYIVSELVTLITDLKEHFSEYYKINEPVYSNHYVIFLGLSNDVTDTVNPLDIIGTFMNLYRHKAPTLKENFVALLKEHVLRYLFIRCTKEQYLKYTDQIITSYGKFFRWSNVSKICNNIIRLTFETCLLCLEFPEIACLNNVSFLIHCLISFLDRVRDNRKNKTIDKALARSLNAHVIIVKASVECTAIANAYTKLLKEWEKSRESVESHLTTLKQFTFTCTKKSGKLSSFDGQRSPMAIKLWLGYNIVNSVIHDSGSMDSEQYINKLDEYLK